MRCSFPNVPQTYHTNGVRNPFLSRCPLNRHLQSELVSSTLRESLDLSNGCGSPSSSSTTPSKKTVVVPLVTSDLVAHPERMLIVNWSRRAGNDETSVNRVYVELWIAFSPSHGVDRTWTCSKCLSALHCVVFNLYSPSTISFWRVWQVSSLRNQIGDAPCWPWRAWI